jgi:hypothetical protein
VNKRSFTVNSTTKLDCFPAHKKQFGHTTKYSSRKK